MIPVTLEYKIGNFIWWKLNRKLPARWSELTPRQMAAIPALQKEELDDTDILEIFLGLKRKIGRRIDSFQRYCILRNLRFIAKPEPLTSFLIGSVAGFNAPARNLQGVTFGTFIFGDTYFQNYINGKEDDLDRFIACYYTDESGFSDKSIEVNAAIIRRADYNTRKAIAINYTLIREWFARAYPYVFRKPEEGSRKKMSTKTWVEIFDLIVGDDVVNEDKYAQKPLSTMLRFMNRKTKEYYKNGGKV